METRAHHVLIGIFTLVAVAAILLFALWLSKASGDRREYDYFQVGFERAVSGLSSGNPVLYSGIRVGDVMDLALDPDDPRKVVARIRVFNDVPIRTDTGARLELTSITGNMNIQLHGGTPESPRLQGSRSDPPMIKADPSPLSSLVTSGEDIVNGLTQLLDNANQLMSEENAERVSRMLTHLELTSETLADHRGYLGKGLTQFNSMVVEFENLAQKLDQLADQQGTELLDSARETAQALEALLEENRGNLDSGLRGLGELGPAIKDLRATLRSLQRLSERLEDNPGDFLLGRESTKEFTP